MNLGVAVDGRGCQAMDVFVVVPFAVGSGVVSLMFDSSIGERTVAKYSSNVIAKPMLSKNQSG